jgi:hypothetical protein
MVEKRSANHLQEWRNRCLEYSKKHNVTYKQAMIALKNKPKEAVEVKGAGIAMGSIKPFFPNQTQRRSKKQLINQENVEGAGFITDALSPIIRPIKKVVRKII